MLLWERNPTCAVWTLRYFQVRMDSQVTKDWQTRGWEGISCVHPGAWKTSFSTDPEATKHRSQTDRKAPQGTCLHMLFFTHSCPLHGEDRGWTLLSLSSLQGGLIDGQRHTRSGHTAALATCIQDTRQPWPHSFRTNCSLGPHSLRTNCSLGHTVCTISYLLQGQHPV